MPASFRIRVEAAIGILLRLTEGRSPSGSPASPLLSRSDNSVHAFRLLPRSDNSVHAFRCSAKGGEQGPLRGYCRPMTNVMEQSQPGLVRDLDTQLRAVVALWESSDAVSEQTRRRATETVVRFSRRVSQSNVTSFADVSPAQCTEFVHARTRDGREPELATKHARRVALHSFYRGLRELGITDRDPAIDVALPPRTTRAARPLTDDEVVLCRTTSRLGRAGAASLQRAVAWSLAETTAITSEISAIRITDVDDPTSPRHVQLPGTKRTSARVGELSEWGSTIVARQITYLRSIDADEDTLLTYKGKGRPGQHVAQAAVCNAIAATLEASGLAEQPDVRPASVRNWAGRRLYDTGVRLEDVARRMGHRSIDACVEDIALEWR
jgi:site-specific recombinase XerD